MSDGRLAGCRHTPIAVPPFRNALLLDASGLVVFAGLLGPAGWATLRRSNTEALDGIFECVRDCLEAGSQSIDMLDAFIFCEGPGSILGIRQSIIAIKTWQSLQQARIIPLYAFRSLETAAAFTLLGEITPPFCMLSGYRRDRWHLLRIDRDASWGALELVDGDLLSRIDEPVYRLPQRRFLPPPPVPTKEIDYDLAQFPAAAAKFNLIHSANEPAVYTAEEVTYRKWKPERHRKPSDAV